MCGSRKGYQDPPPQAPQGSGNVAPQGHLRGHNKIRVGDCCPGGGSSSDHAGPGLPPGPLSGCAGEHLRESRRGWPGLCRRLFALSRPQPCAPEAQAPGDMRQKPGKGPSEGRKTLETTPAAEEETPPPLYYGVVRYVVGRAELCWFHRVEFCEVL